MVDNCAARATTSPARALLAVVVAAAVAVAEAADAHLPARPAKERCWLRAWAAPDAEHLRRCTYAHTYGTKVVQKWPNRCKLLLLAGCGLVSASIETATHQPGGQGAHARRENA